MKQSLLQLRFLSELLSEGEPQTATGRKAAAKATAQAGSCLTGTAEGNDKLDVIDCNCI